MSHNVPVLQLPQMVQVQVFKHLKIQPPHYSTMTVWQNKQLSFLLQKRSKTWAGTQWGVNFCRSTLHDHVKVLHLNCPNFRNSYQLFSYQTNKQKFDVVMVAAGDTWTPAYWPLKYVYMAASIIYFLCVYSVSWWVLKQTGLWANKIKEWLNMGWVVIWVAKSVPWVGMHTFLLVLIGLSLETQVLTCLPPGSGKFHSELYMISPVCVVPALTSIYLRHWHLLVDYFPILPILWYLLALCFGLLFIPFGVTVIWTSVPIWYS